MSAAHSRMPCQQHAALASSDSAARERTNSRTGRPVRAGAGKKAMDPSYVSTAEAVEDVEFEESASSSSGDESDRPIKKKKKKKAVQKKRKRSPSPPAPPLPPIHEPLLRIDESDIELHLADPTTAVHAQDTSQGISLTFNIPKGFEGPFVINLDVDFLQKAHQLLLLRATTHEETAPLKKRCLANASRPSALPKSASAEKGKSGFLKLPPELRNKIYRLLFVSVGPLDFWDPSNFCRSGAFLRTCKQINHEGCGILYGENVFRFSRNRSSRGMYWDPRPVEIGYTDMRRFLDDIGSKNLLNLRDIFIIFEDCAPSSNPLLTTNESRRFIHDLHLQECLRLLGNGCQLKTIEFSFQGRKTLDETYGANRFLEALGRIKADKVGITKDPRLTWNQTVKVSWGVKNALILGMTRRKKLYAD